MEKETKDKLLKKKKIIIIIIIIKMDYQNREI